MMINLKDFNNFMIESVDTDKVNPIKIWIFNADEHARYLNVINELDRTSGYRTKWELHNETNWKFYVHEANIKFPKTSFVVVLTNHPVAAKRIIGSIMTQSSNVHFFSFDSNYYGDDSKCEIETATDMIHRAVRETSWSNFTESEVDYAVLILISSTIDTDENDTLGHKSMVDPILIVDRLKNLNINLTPILLSNIRKRLPEVYKILMNDRDEGNRWKTDLTADMGDMGF